MHEKRDWQKIISDCQASSLTIAQYCDQLGIANSTFYTQRKKLKNRLNNVIPAQKPAPKTKFVEVIPPKKTALPAKPMIKISTDCGKTVEIFL